MPDMLHYRLYILILAYGLLSFVLPLQAQHWSNPATISILGQNASHPQITIDPFGNATAVWYRFDGNHLIVQASTKPYGGNWQAVPDNLSLSDQDSFNPQIAVDSFGNITVVWERFNGSHSIIQATTKPFGGSWQWAPQQISWPGQNACAPQIAVDSFGNATIVWHAFNGTNYIIQASTKPLGGSWQGVPSNLSLPGLNAKNAQIVIDAYETATVVWQASNGFQEVIQASSRLFQKEWQSMPDTISVLALNNSSPQVGADSFGNVTVVWNQFNGAYGTIQASTKIYGGNWQSNPDTISILGNNTFSPQIAVDTFGDVTVVWESSGSDKLRCIHASTKLFGENWQTYPDILSPPGDHNVNPQIAIDSSGNTLVVWNNYKGFTRIHVSKRNIGGNWQLVPDIISSPGRSAFFPQLAVDSLGRAIVIWVMQDSLSFIQAANQ